jgi:putative endonuclease
VFSVPPPSEAEVVAMNASVELGQRGEQLAAELLRQSGMRILDRNWRCDAGEIDIVAAEGRALVVCEVKTRSTTRYGTPLESISARKHARLRRLAIRWVTAHGLTADEIRIDVVGVLLGSGPDDVAIEHMRGVG